MAGSRDHVNPSRETWGFRGGGYIQVPFLSPIPAGWNHHISVRLKLSPVPVRPYDSNLKYPRNVRGEAGGAGLVGVDVITVRGCVVGTIVDLVVGTVAGRDVMAGTGTSTVSTKDVVPAYIGMDFDLDWWSRSRSSRVWEPARSITVTGVVPRYTLSRYTSAPGGVEDTSPDPVSGISAGLSSGPGDMHLAIRTRVMSGAEGFLRAYA